MQSSGVHSAYKFQSTHPHGVRLLIPTSAVNSGTFQSTHPHGVRRRADRLLSAGEYHFNPRTRMGCDTLICPPTPPLFGISIHAPAWGATWWRSAARRCAQHFNPRTRMGCDSFISIFLRSAPLFQSTHPHGVRLIFFNEAGDENIFQSTHPHGVRLIGFLLS